MNRIVGYTCGCWDMLHVGHINLLRSAKALCDKLIVGVSTDELIIEYKNRKPIIPFKDRIKIIRAIRYVDIAIPQFTLDKVETFDLMHYNILIVGDDHKKEEKWMEYEAVLNHRGAEVIYLPYTKGISSSQLRKGLINE